MFLKSIIISAFILLFSACTSNNFFYDNAKSSVSFPLNQTNKNINLTNAKYENTFSGCSLDTYTLSDENSQYGKLFIEHIRLADNCQWNGLASGYFTYEFKTRMKFKSFDLADRFVKQNYEISTYKVNGEKYLSIIEIYSVGSNIFILDNSGKLSFEIIKSLDSNYVYKYLNEPRTDIKYNFSLVQNNAFFSYFGRESEEYLK